MDTETDWNKIWGELEGARGGVPEVACVRFLSRVFGRGLPGKRILDVGSGTGANTLWLEGMGADVVAIDPSERCRVHYHMTVQSFTAPPDSFDSIIDIKTLCHDRDAEAQYKRIYRWLKPGGWLFVMCPSIVHKADQSRYRDVGAGKAFTRYPSEWELRAFFTQFDSCSIRAQIEPSGETQYLSTWCVEAQK